MKRLLLAFFIAFICLPFICAEDEQFSDTTLIGEGEELLSLDEMDDETGSIPEWVQTRLVGDTLFVSGDLEQLSRRLIVVANNGEAVYRLLPHNRYDTLRIHPADSIYRHMWTNQRVNPYQLSVDSIKDSLYIDVRGFHMPHNGYITSRFGWRKYRFHHGTDIKVQVGDSIRASWDGQVRIVGWDPRGYGYYVVIRHNNGLETVYGHLSMPLFDENEPILSGDVLGLGGNTGRSTGSHLHYEIRYLGNAFNPEKLINFDTHQLTCTDTYILTKKGTYAHVQDMKAQAQAQYHKVRSGDTLSGIAKKYRTRVSTLCKLNRIKETTILQIGQRIRVR